MRPQSIVNFERLYLGALALGIVNLALAWNQTVASIEAQSNAQMGSGLMYMGVAIAVVIPLLLWYFVARKASVVAKWILVAFFLLNVIATVTTLAKGTYAEGLGGILGAITLLMQAAAVYFLLRPDAKAWFADGRGGADAGPAR